MSIPLSRKFEGKKFMWDGAAYDTEDQARQTMEVYRKNGFEVQVSQNTDKYLVYSRRIAAVQAAAQ
ncbi:MAG: hypothetical protein C4519_26895 [Desulfobacteraceae bacterium]|nr:MAG: hypothetical protein C4519_26895 [Desulfobacteraceae bacterium]